MPKAARQCPTRGCTTLIRHTKHCPAHTVAWAGPRTASSISHNTPEWRRCRPRVLRRDKYTCQIHGPRCTHHATEVDLITAASRGGPITEHNMQAACHTCHVQKTRDERDLL